MIQLIQVNKHNIRLGRIFLCFTSNIHQTYDEVVQWRKIFFQTVHRKGG